MREDVPRSHVKVIHNGLDWEGAVRTQREAIDAWRARFQPQVLLVAAGRLTFQKDYPTLLRAFSLLREEHPQTHLVIAGTGSEQEHETMLALLKQNRIEDAVTLAGWIPDVYSLMAAADIFVHAALEEAFCQAVVEAAGLGVPVVSTSAGAVPEILGEIHVPLPTRDASTPRHGFLTRSSNWTARRPERANAAHIRGRFTAARMAQQYLEAYRDVATPRGRNDQAATEAP